LAAGLVDQKALWKADMLELQKANRRECLKAPLWEPKKVVLKELQTADTMVHYLVPMMVPQKAHQMADQMVHQMVSQKDIQMVHWLDVRLAQQTAALSVDQWVRQMEQ
jgi:hypothetical protein